MSTATVLRNQIPERIRIKHKISPFVRWAGGKRWLFRNYRYFFDGVIEGRYIEPFLGGGSIFAGIQPEWAILSDYNEELINLYQQVRDYGECFQYELKRLEKIHSIDFYYRMRGARPEAALQRAFRFLYLNRTCFNGIYRVNRKGEFNVPIGTKTRLNLPSDNFEGWYSILENVDIYCADFEIVIARAEEGDFIFADPPYTVSHSLDGFIKYNEVLFSMEDQIRLRDSLVAAKDRGARIVATNANHPSVINLYKDRFHITEVSRRSNVAASTANRGIYSEIIIYSHEVHK